MGCGLSTTVISEGILESKSGMEKSEKLLDKVKHQVQACLRRQDDKVIADVFRKYKDDLVHGLKHGTEGIFKENLQAAMRELDLYIQTDTIDNIFLTMDVNDDGYLDLEEFKIAVHRSSPMEQWTASFPLTKLVASALLPIIDMFPAYKDSDPLRALSLCSDEDVGIACNGVMEGISKMVLLRIKELRQSYAAMDAKALEKRENVEDSKFTVGTMSCGDIPSFFKGLGERVGIFPFKPGIVWNCITLFPTCRVSEPQIHGWDEKRTLCAVRQQEGIRHSQLRTADVASK